MLFDSVPEIEKVILKVSFSKKIITLIKKFLFKYLRKVKYKFIVLTFFKYLFKYRYYIHFSYCCKHNKVCCIVLEVKFYKAIIIFIADEISSTFNN